jgi:hypothetical protein
VRFDRRGFRGLADPLRRVASPQQHVNSWLSLEPYLPNIRLGADLLLVSGAQFALMLHLKARALALRA